MRWRLFETPAFGPASPAAQRERWLLRAVLLAAGAFLWNLEGPFLLTWWIAGVVAGVLGVRGAAFAIVLAPLALLAPSYEDTQRSSSP